MEQTANKEQVMSSFTKKIGQISKKRVSNVSMMFDFAAESFCVRIYIIL